MSRIVDNETEVRVLEQLTELGLDNREAQFYLAVLRLGRTTIARAAREAHVSRTSGYDLAKRLLDRGMLQAIEFGDGALREDRSRTELMASDPTRLYEEVERRRTLLDRLVPELRMMQTGSAGRPRVRYLEGVTGIRDALFETLDWPSPIRGVFSMKDLFTLPGEDALDDYVASRREHDLTLRVVRSRGHDVSSRWGTSAEDLRDARYAPDGYSFTMTTIIGDHTVAVISSYREGFAMMIDSREYALTQTNLFEVLWSVSTPAAAT